jgi:hypothetical protein
MEVFPELRKQKAAKDRIISPDDVIAAAPDVILASWCGKKVVPDKIRHGLAGMQSRRYATATSSRSSRR